MATGAYTTRGVSCGGSCSLRIATAATLVFAIAGCMAGAPATVSGDGIVRSGNAGAQPGGDVVAPGVAGRVIGADGQPVAGAFVEAFPIGDSPAVPELAVFTAGDGTYRWFLQPGNYQITITADGSRTTAIVSVVEGTVTTSNFILQ